jgi:hypothetical protein
MCPSKSRSPDSGSSSDRELQKKCPSFESISPSEEIRLERASEELKIVKVFRFDEDADSSDMFVLYDERAEKEIKPSSDADSSDVDRDGYCVIRGCRWGSLRKNSDENRKSEA